MNFKRLSGEYKKLYVGQELNNWYNVLCKKNWHSQEKFLLKESTVAFTETRLLFFLATLRALPEASEEREILGKENGASQVVVYNLK